MSWNKENERRMIKTFFHFFITQPIVKRFYWWILRLEICQYEILLAFRHKKNRHVQNTWKKGKLISSFFLNKIRKIWRRTNFSLIRNHWKKANQSLIYCFRWNCLCWSIRRRSIMSIAHQWRMLLLILEGQKSVQLHVKWKVLHPSCRLPKSLENSSYSVVSLILITNLFDKWSSLWQAFSWWRSAATKLQLQQQEFRSICLVMIAFIKRVFKFSTWIPSMMSWLWCTYQFVYFAFWCV